MQIIIDKQNAAFDDGDNGNGETARILKEIVKDLERGGAKEIYKDWNGNTVCKIINNKQESV